MTTISNGNFLVGLKHVFIMFHQMFNMCQPYLHPSLGYFRMVPPMTLAHWVPRRRVRSAKRSSQEADARERPPDKAGL